MRRKPHPLRRPLGRPLRRLLLAAAAGAPLGACVAIPPKVEAVNVESPAAGAIMTVQSERLPFPSFRDVPPKPADIAPPSGYATTVASLNGERRTLNGWVVDNPPMIAGTEAYAATTRQGVGSTPADAPQTDVTPAITAWAKAQRDAAQPPPPPQKPATPPPAPNPPPSQP